MVQSLPSRILKMLPHFALRRGSLLGRLMVLGTLACSSMPRASTFAADPPGDHGNVPAWSVTFGEELSRAVKGQDPSALATLVDGEAMFQEVEHQQILEGLSPAEKTAFQIALRVTLGRTLLQEANTQGWNACHVTCVQPSPSNNAAVVYMQALRKDGSPVALVRLWVVAVEQQWRIFDWQNSAMLYPASTQLSMVSALIGGSRAAAIRLVANAASKLRSGQLAAAEIALQKISPHDLPPSFQAAAEMIRALADIAHHDYQNALSHLEAVGQIDPGTPLLVALESRALAGLKKWREASLVVQGPINERGEDEQQLVALGNALSGLGQNGEAVRAYQRALQWNPTSVESIIGLASVGTDADLPLVAGQFKRLANPVGQFPQIATALVSRQKPAALRALLTAYDQLGGSHFALAFYSAKLKVLTKDYAGAAQGFRELANATQDARVRRSLLGHFLEVKLAEGTAVEGYRTAWDQPFAFAYLAPRLAAKEDGAALEKLVQLHQAASGGNVSDHYYLGLSRFMAKDYAGAEKIWADGVRQVKNARTVERFRQMQTLALFKSGKGMEAYQALEPKQATFNPLADLYFAAHDADRLEALLAAHRKVAPNDILLSLWSAEAKCLRKDYAHAAASLAAILPRLQRIGLKGARPVVDRFLDLSMSAGEALKAYQAMPELRFAPGGQGAVSLLDKPYAFGYLASHLLGLHDAATVAALAKLHAAGYPNDPRLLFYYGQAHMLTRQYAEAERAFVLGMQQHQNLQDVWTLYHAGWTDAMLCQGKWRDAYLQSGGDREAFPPIARTLAELKDAKALAELVVLHQTKNGDDPSLPIWRAEVLWLNQRYQEAADVLDKNRETINGDQHDLARCEDRFIRSLVRLKRHGPALEEAKALTSRDGDPWYELLVHTAAGNVPGTADALARCREHGYTAHDFLDDPDIGPALRQDSFQALREKVVAQPIHE